MTPQAEVTFLLADDDPDDRLLAEQALRETRLNHQMAFVEDGAELLDYLRRRGRFEDPVHSPRPRVILLDLNMPHVDGRQALAEIKSDPQLRGIPVVVMTTSQVQDDITRSYQLGANACITKPTSFDGLVDVMRSLASFWLEVAQLPGSAGGSLDG